MASQKRIVKLSSIIASNTTTLNNFLVENNLPEPSFEADALWALPIPDDNVDVKAARIAIIDSCIELQALVTGPKELLRYDAVAYVSVRIILRLKLDKSFLVGASTSFEAMAKVSGLSVMNVRRVVRHAILCHRFFQEKKPGVITHSALTAVLAGDALTRNALIVQLQEFAPAGTKAADALENWPNSEENNETGFSLANNSTKSMYDIFALDPGRGSRFGTLFSRPDEPFHMLLDNYPWHDVETFVDVGGSHGSIAVALAERFPHIKCVVQDLPDTVVEGASRLAPALKDRVEFMAHDFFTAQAATADVYYFRSIFHNWSDKYCIKILQALIPALKHGARIIIHERMLPPHDALASADAKPVIKMDILMLQLLNAQQREAEEWLELFRRADSRYRYIGAKQPKGGVRWIIEARWDG
ncbi:S-adenosyl-L-methionine-dependent methyltransferase [Cucurbitaria berberidis CBS 394.84]|uniref:S-adenosyl-L-methionine-dependent methyltransferase n=1 Tax=Cucurbitaria berberidis CBS 394.84 TaxID=1168544 RepID=A0A9P4L4U8_9PLEO|nr:S-adenosyl-L-methionine-dependent methyltransferase [Cucurbitaria berberidis CBS 394.84]KAF1841298.1 S-adenosyl-L-methionine-dependent methyltransferase [Cucurbitaria berberidis CBS 394.84]